MFSFTTLIYFALASLLGAITTASFIIATYAATVIRNRARYGTDTVPKYDAPKYTAIVTADGDVISGADMAMWRAARDSDEERSPRTRV